MSLVSALPSFERMVSAMASLTNAASNLMIQALGNTPQSHPRIAALTAGESLLNGPLGDVLARCLDVWSLLLGDPLLAGPALSLAQEESTAAANLRSSLQDLCRVIFERLYDSVLGAVVQDTLQSVDKDIDMESDDIEERYVCPVMSGLCLKM